MHFQACADSLRFSYACIRAAEYSTTGKKDLSLFVFWSCWHNWADVIGADLIGLTVMGGKVYILMILPKNRTEELNA